jgi:hypothetical protein
LKVSDTGSGIAPEIVDKIFDPFFTTKGLETGTGLGLATVQGIVKSHEGFVLVESQVGRGTHFSVYLPALPEAGVAAAAATDQELPRGHGEWVLVADDEKNIREIRVSRPYCQGWDRGDSFIREAPGRNPVGVDRHDDAGYGRRSYAPHPAQDESPDQNHCRQRLPIEGQFDENRRFDRARVSAKTFHRPDTPGHSRSSASWRKSGPDELKMKFAEAHTEAKARPFYRKNQRREEKNDAHAKNRDRLEKEFFFRYLA